MPQARPDGAPRPAFSAGDVVASRFEVVRFLGRGGMGEVYEVEDRLLQGRIALKTIRPEAAGDARFVERFQHEVQLARKVTHPNVCQTFDLGRHEPEPADGSAPVRFVTMELLAGETLAQRIDQRGPLAAADAQPIAVQIAAGLHAAHEAGVIHQDLKSDNVALVPSDGGVRAVVADFGLAEAKAAGADRSGGGTVSGTPAYMAPEQVAGRGVTVASDVYALGVVLYEMVTGQLPFPGRSLQAAMKRLKEPVPSPRTHVPELDPRWEAVILRCLERDPLDRFASAADVARALRGEEVVPSRRALMQEHARRRVARRRKRIALVLGLLATAAVGELLFLRFAQRRAPQRRSVAVLGFRNLSGRTEAAWLSTALGEMLTVELGAGEGLRMVPGETVARMKLDLALPEADLLAQDTLARVGRNLGSEFVLLGSYFATGSQDARLRVDLRLQETGSGQTLALLTEEATEAGFPELVTRAGARLRECLKMGALSVADAGGARAAAPAGAEATRLYAEGLSKLRLFDALQARDLLEKAIAADPESPLAHSALAEAWAALGYDGKAKQAAKRAFDLSPKLPREQRLLVEGRYREAARERDKAVDVYRTLFGFFSDNAEYGLRLAESQTGAGKAKDALVTVEALRKLGAPAAADPRIDLAEARAAEALSELKRARAAAARAAATGTTLGARMLVAEARWQEGRALSRLSEYASSITTTEEARRLFAEVGDRSGGARCLNQIALGVRVLGDLARARTTFQEALAISRATGDLAGQSATLDNVADLLRQEGDLASAKRTYEEALAIHREIGDRRGVSRSIQSVAGVLRQQGDLVGAMRMYEQALAIRREVGDKRAIAGSLSSLATELRQQGDLEAARSLHEQALAIRRETGDKWGIAWSLSRVASVLSLQGDLLSARRMHEEALAKRREIDEKSGIAWSLGSIAFILQLQGDLAQATAKYEESLSLYREVGDKSGVSTQLNSLGHALRQRGELRAARESHEQAVGLNRELGSKSGIAHSLYGLGHVLLAAGDLTGARRAYEEALALREQMAQRGEAAVTRVALGRLALEAGRPFDADAPARDAAQAFAKEKRIDDECEARAVLLRSVLARGRLREAQEALGRVQELGRQSQSFLTRLTVALSTARVRIATGQATQAVKGIEDALAQAQDAGYVAQSFDLRLALGECELKAGRRDARQAAS